MTIAQTITHRSLVGDMIRVYGTYTVSNDATGGNLNVNMDRCLFIKLEHDAATVLAADPVANETFPCDGKAVTIVTSANETGRFYAEGEGLGY